MLYGRFTQDDAMPSIGNAPTYTDNAGGVQEAQGVFGYMRSEEWEAVREGRAFVASTAVVAVEIGQILAFVMVNPSDSGVNVHLVNRRFTSDQVSGDVPVEYRAYTNPTYVPSTAGVVVNRWVGSPTSDVTFRYTAGSSDTITMGGTAGSAETIRTGGGASERQLLVVIPPGNSLGFTVTGAGQNLSQATRVSGTLEWYEESV